MTAQEKDLFTRALLFIYYTLLLAVVTAALPLVIIWQLFAGDDRR